MRKVENKLLAGTLFLALACGLSWPLMFCELWYREEIHEWGIPPMALDIFLMWGPGIAALIMYLLMGSCMPKSYTIFGQAPSTSMMFYLLPFGIWAMLLILIPEEQVNALNLLLLIPLGFVVFLGQEIAWRGFLHDLILRYPLWLKGLIIGLMWETWNFNRGIVGLNIKEAIIQKAILIFLSVIVAIVLEYGMKKTHSLAVVITIHAWIRIQLDYPFLSTQIAFIASLFIWVLLIIAWPTRKAKIEGWAEHS